MVLVISCFKFFGNFPSIRESSQQRTVHFPIFMLHTIQVLHLTLHKKNLYRDTILKPNISAMHNS